MTIQSQLSSASYQENGTSLTFNIPFLFYLPSDVTVYSISPPNSVTPALGGVVAILVYGVDYTLAGAANPQGGTLTKMVAQPSGWTLKIALTPPLTQLTHFQPNEPFPSATVEQSLDRAIQVCQWLFNQIADGIQVNPADPPGPLILPPAAMRAGTIFGFDANGNISLGTPVSQPLSQALIGQYFYGPTALEVLNSATIKQPWYVWGDFRRYGASINANAAGTQGNDDTAAINMALAIIGQPALHPSGNALFTNILHPGDQMLMAPGGIHACNLIAKPGSSGIAYTDSGSAAKLDISGGIAIYCNTNAYSAGFKAGYNSGVYGTEAVIEALWVRDLPPGSPNIDITGNVGELGFLIAQNGGGLRIAGTGMMLERFENVGALGFTNTAGKTVGTDFGDIGIGSGHIEAPASGIIPLYCTGQVRVGAQPTMSLAIGTTFDHLVEYSRAATSYRLFPKFYVHAGTPVPNVTGGNQMDYSGPEGAAVYFGGILANGSTTDFGDSEKDFHSSVFVTTPDLWYDKALRQSFSVRVSSNGSGVISHQMGMLGNPTIATAKAGQINDSSVTPVNTPTGADATTAFANGMKIGATSPSLLIFDTDDQLNMSTDVRADAGFNNTGTTYKARAGFVSINVDGVTRTRLYVQLLNPTTGVGVTWSSALGDSNIIDVDIDGWLR